MKKQQISKKVQNYEALYEQGLAHEKSKDYKEAYECYQHSANDRYYRALTNIGLLYLRGLGVEQDKIEACKYLLKAAQKGHARAQYNLATMLRHGDGIEKDLVQALHWYKAAVDQDDKKAQEKFVQLQNELSNNISCLSPREIHTQELKIDKELGRGNFGIVYLGYWNNISVAIKTLQLTSGSSPYYGEPDINLPPEKIQAFATEVEAMTSVRHPNLVTLLGICKETDKYFIVMEYMQKGSLHNFLHSTQPLNWLLRWQIALDIANGLSELHKHDILHRDLRSVNVLLNGNMHAKISDLGLARWTTDEGIAITKSRHQSTGVVEWLAPELFDLKVRKCTAKSDIYSYGIVLWELVTRQEPYGDIKNDEGRVGKIAATVMSGQRLAIPEDCPSVLAQLIIRCWSQQPSDRPDASEIISILQSNMHEVEEFDKKDKIEPVAVFSNSNGIFHHVQPKMVDIADDSEGKAMQGLKLPI